METSSDHGRNIQWDSAILALIQHSTHEKAAKAAGVNPATLYRWQKIPEFQKALQEARRQVFGQATGRLQLAASIAVDTLIAIMQDPKAGVGGRVQAAKCVLESSRQSLALEDLKIEVADLRRSLRTVTAELAAKNVPAEMSSEEDLSKVPEANLIQQQQIMRETLTWAKAETEDGQQATDQASEEKAL